MRRVVHTARRVAICACCLLALTAPSRAGGHWPADGTDQAMPCRPTIACTADIVPAGDLELEVGYVYRRLEHGAPQHTTPFLLKLSITKWLQLQAEGNGYTVTNAAPRGRYFDDVGVGAKLHLAAQHDLFPSLSWSFLVDLPMPSQEGYVRAYDVLLTAYISESIGKLHADLNIGMNLWHLSDITVQPWVALALSYELPRNFVAMVEMYYFAVADPYSSRDGGTLLGVSYAPRSWLVLDTGVDVGWFQRERSVSAFVGMTVIVANLWAKRPPMR